jgi:hypothetical protein
MSERVPGPTPTSVCYCEACLWCSDELPILDNDPALTQIANCPNCTGSLSSVLYDNGTNSGSLSDSQAVYQMLTAANVTPPASLTARTGN